MKKILFAAGLLTLGFSGVYAQDTKTTLAPKSSSPTTASGQTVSKMDPSVMARMQASRLQRELALTSEQSTQLKPILDAAATEGKGALNSPETEKKIKAILTPDQVTKFDDMKAKREAAMKARQEQMQKTPNQ